MKKLLDALKGVVSDEKAAKYLAKIRAELFDDEELTDIGLSKLRLDQFERVVPHAGAAVVLFEVTRPAGSPPVSEEFKAKRAAKYTDEEIATFAERLDTIADHDTKMSLLDELTQRTQGMAYRILVNGVFDAKASGGRISAIRSGKPLASFVTVNGIDVTPLPLMPAEDEFAEDPFQDGEPLGQPGDVSNFLGVSLAGISIETRRAIRHARAHDLRGAPLAILQTVASEAAGKTPDEVLKKFPKARMAWAAVKDPASEYPLKVKGQRQDSTPRFSDDFEPRASLKVPSEPAPPASEVVVFSIHANTDKQYSDAVKTSFARRAKYIGISDVPAGTFMSEWVKQQIQSASLVLVFTSMDLFSNDALLKYVDFARSTGVLVVPVKARVSLPEGWYATAQSLPKTGVMRDDVELKAVEVAANLFPLLKRTRTTAKPPRPDIYEIHSAAIQLEIDRESFFSDINRRVVASLSNKGSPAEVLLMDITTLKRSYPAEWKKWISNAVQFSANREEQHVFVRELAHLS